MRRILLILAVIAALALLAYTVWEQRDGPVTQGDPWASVPADALLVMEISEPLDVWNKTASTNQIWQSLSAIPAISELTALLDEATASWQDDTGVEKALGQSDLLISVRPISPKELGVSLALGLPSNVPEKRIVKALGAIFPTITEADLNNGSVVPEGGDQPWNIRLNDHVLTLSSSEEGTTGEWIPATVSQRLRGTFGSGADAHVIFHTDKGLRLIDRFLKPAKQRTLNTPSGYIAADVQMRPGSIIMSGVLLPDSNETDLNALVSNGDSRPPTLSLLPKEVDRFHLLKYKDARELRDARERSMNKNDPRSAALNDTLGSDVIDLLTSWVDGEMVLARNTSTTDAWILINSYQSDIARSSLLRFSDDDNTSTHRESEILAIHEPEAFAIAYGPPFNSVDVSHGVVLDNAVVLCNSLRAAKAAINARNDAGALQMDDRASRELDDLPATARMINWTDVARSSDDLMQWLDVADTSSTVKQVISSLGGATFSFLQQKKGLHYVSASIHHAPLQQRGSNILWAAELPSPVARTPDLLINHYTKTKEAFVQLEDHSVVLISSTGKQLWQAPLDGPILGEVHQVDRYRNGKLQMLFNTENKLYLIDRNGNAVDGYPIVAACTAPLSLFDYDNDGKLRILVPGDNSVRNFDLSGKEVKGWNKPQVGKVMRPLKHLRIRNKDYLMAVNDEGKIHLLDRQGKSRYDAELSLADASDQLLRVAPGANIGITKVTWIDTTGRSIASFIDDEKGVTISDRQLGDHHLQCDLDKDGEEEIIIANGNELMIYNSDGTTFTYNYDEPITAGPLAIDLGPEEKLIGIISGEQVMLIDRLGRELHGTPLTGNSSFRVADLNLDGILELVTTTPGGQLVAYALEK